jgi:uncharacterized damage-inducible protein DinB
MSESHVELMTKPKVLQELRDARSAWDALIAQAVTQRGKAALTAPGAAGSWSVRDLIAHLTSYDRWFVNAAEAQMRGEPPPLDGTEWMPWDERNAIHHARTLHLLLDDVLDDSRQTYDGLLDLVEQLPETFLIEPQQPPGVPEPFVVWEQLRGNTYDHYRLHSVDVQAWLG